MDRGCCEGVGGKKMEMPRVEAQVLLPQRGRAGGEAAELCLSVDSGLKTHKQRLTHAHTHTHTFNPKHTLPLLPATNSISNHQSL